MTGAASGLLERFRDRFGGGDARVYRAPGRLNLIGEHTDYNDGFVLPAAIEQSAWVAGRARDDRVVRVHAGDLGREVSFALDDPAPAPARDWRDYPRGVAIELERGGSSLRGADLLLRSDVPMGAGLSSSAAIEVAVAWALLDLAGHAPDPLAVARTCQRAENAFVGARCGIMDQFASAHGREGHVLLLDCRSLAMHPVALPSDLTLVVCDSGVAHALAAGAYNQRRAECEEAVRVLRQGRPSIDALRDVGPDELEARRGELPDTIYRRARHVVGECRRVGEAVDALERGDLRRAGELVDASHDSLRDDYEVSCPELDLLVTIAREQPGVLGSRMMGGGFGGSTITLARSAAVPDLIAALDERYRAAYGKPARARVCRPADGAQRVV